MTEATSPIRKPETLRVRCTGDQPFPGSAIFGRGVRIQARTGASIRDLLCRQLGVSGSYLDDRIQTIFLNGSPVDDVDKTRVEDGAVLSLSAAMPGLVGATLRRGGHLAAFRKNISYTDPGAGSAPGTGQVTLKLFNMVAKELGPRLLERGVLVPARDLAGPLKNWKNTAEEVFRNDAPVSEDDLADLFDSDADVFFRVDAPPG